MGKVVISPQQTICLQWYSAIAIRIINRKLWKGLKAFQDLHKAAIGCSSWLGMPMKLHNTWDGLLKHGEEQRWNSLAFNILDTSNHQQTSLSETSFKPKFPTSLFIYISINKVSHWHASLSSVNNYKLEILRKIS